MTLRHLLALLSLLALTAACDAPAGAAGDAPEAAAPTSPVSDAVRAALLEGPVTVLDSGNWSRVLACSGNCISEYSFWVDVAVRNDAYEKRVGILWTDSGWASVNTAYATYEGPLEGGYEKWGIDVIAGQAWSAPREIEYAVFVAMNGATAWDPHNNYYVYNKVSPTAPVRRLSSEVHTESGRGIVFTGRARVFDLAFEKQVTVRYTTDGWATSADVDATWQTQDDWTFRVEGLPTDPLPAALEYAIRYQVAGSEYWDNNGGQNYRHTLEPAFQPGWMVFDLARPIAGVFALWSNFATDLPNEGMRVRLDGGAWSDGQAVTFTTADMADGPHVAAYKLLLPGGFEYVHESPFVVENHIVPLDAWNPTPTVPLNPLAEPPAIWDAAVDSEGRVVTVSELPDGHRVVRYDGYGEDADPLVFDPTPATEWQSVWTVATDDRDRVYAVSPWNDRAIFRYKADGHIDPTFGDAGKVDLDAEIEGAPFCYAGDIVANAHHVYVVDSCNSRIVRFGLDGRPDGAATVGDDAMGMPSALWHDADGLWVLHARALTRLVDTATQPLRVESSVTLANGFEFNSAAGLARTGDGTFWAGDGMGRLVALTSGGDILASWWGGVRTLAGGFELPRTVVALPDDTVAILGAAAGRFARFSAELR